MTKKDAFHNLLILPFLIVFILHPLIANGQNIVSADPSNTFDSQSIFINPAVIPFQHRQVTLGMKVYQLGFLKDEGLGLHNGCFSLSWPQTFSGLINLGLTGQNFSVPLYDQTTLSIIIAKRLIERLSLGIKYNLFTKSYHQRYFELVDPADPVFAHGTLKLAHSFGFGLIIFPWSTLSVGFSCDHLNRPDVSLYQDKFKQPLIYDFGIRYSFGYFSSSIYLNCLQRHWQFNWVFESRPSASSIFKLGFVQKAAKFSAEFYLFNGISINYIFDYPFYEVNQVSSGSHHISFIYNLDHGDRIKELQFTRYNEGKIPIFNLPSQFFVEIDTDNLEIISQKIIRTIEDNIPKEALKNLTEVEIAYHDSSHDVKQVYKHGSLPEENLSTLHGSAKYSEKYLEYLKRLAENSQSIPINSLGLIVYPISEQRATELRDSLVTSSPMLNQQIEIKQLENYPVTKRIEPQVLHRSSQEQRVSLNPELVSFHISSLKIRNYRGEWKLIISDYSGNNIKTVAGKGDVPREIYWDWRDNNGNLIRPDIYYYYFLWETKKGQLLHTQPKTFSVSKISRTLNIDICSNPIDTNDLGTVIEIKFAH